MEQMIVRYNVRLELWFRRDGRDWLAWCPSIDVTVQDRTRKGALESLREAVEGWFESCIERGVLAEALAECKFSSVPQGQSVGIKNVVEVIKRRKHQASVPVRPGSVSFTLGHKNRPDFIEGVLPAYIAAQQLGDTARAFA